MYKIYADNKLIYDSELEDYKICKGSISLETSKSGTFTFSIYPDHFFYDKFVKLKTIITVYKSGKIVFRGRILNDVTDYWNNKVITCEGELGFLQDSIIRPFDFSGNPRQLFVKLIREHNSQVDNFKKFKVGTVTYIDSNDYIARSNSGYESTLNNLTSRLVESELGGYLYITHGEDGTEEIPTLNYLVDFTNESSQSIEFGSNLKNFTKTVKAENIATAIIPLGKEIDDGNDESENKKLTIAGVNNGVDYVSDVSAVAMYGFICKVVEWNDVTDPLTLKKKAEAYLSDAINQATTIELNAIDLHLLDHSIESFKIGDYIRVTSEPHKFNSLMLCNKQTMDLLKPENDTVTLGYTYSSFTEFANKVSSYSGAIDEAKLEMLKKINAHDLAVQRLTQLMTNSFGLYKSEERLEDGSTVYYMHDLPELSKSKTIWKMTADAFAVSTDGGKTWTAGMDSDGNAVVTILSAVGVKSEWLDVDNLSAINSNIGGWKIDENGLYKDITASDKTVYRVYFQAPNDTALGDQVLSCKKSTDGGSSFESAFILYSDGSAKFGTTSIDSDGAIRFGGDLEILEDGSILWRSPQGGYPAQITRQSDGSIHMAMSSAEIESLSFTKVGGNTPLTGAINIPLNDGSIKTLKFVKGVLVE